MSSSHYVICSEASSFSLMYQSNRSLNIPPSKPRTFDAFPCPGGRAFDYHSWGLVNLIASLDYILRVALIPRGLVNHGGDGGDKLHDEYKGKDCVFESDWLKSKAYTSCVPYLKVFKNDLYL